MSAFCHADQFHTVMAMLLLPTKSTKYLVIEVNYDA